MHHSPHRIGSPGVILSGDIGDSEYIRPAAVSQAQHHHSDVQCSISMYAVPMQVDANRQRAGFHIRVHVCGAHGQWMDRMAMEYTQNAHRKFRGAANRASRGARLHGGKQQQRVVPRTRLDCFRCCRGQRWRFTGGDQLGVQAHSPHQQTERQHVLISESKRAEKSVESDGKRRRLWRVE